MRIRISVAAAGLMALGACGGGEDNKAAANGAAAAETAEASAGGGDEIRLEPGEWETKVEVTNVSMPGMPGMDEMMKSMNSTTRSCMTEQDVGKPDMFTGKQADTGCKAEGFEVKGGKVSGTVTCEGKAGEGKMTMKTEGRFTPTSFESTATQETDMDGMKMKMDVRVTGRRIGECPASAKAQG